MAEGIYDRLQLRKRPSCNVVRHFVNSLRVPKSKCVSVQGPPGTGKTTFIVTLLQILWHCGHSWIACAPSNSATDHLATVLQQACPEIRFHAYEKESGALRRQEQALATENNTEDEKEDTSGLRAQVETESMDPQAAQDNRIFCGYWLSYKKKISNGRASLLDQISST